MNKEHNINKLRKFKYSYRQGTEITVTGIIHAYTSKDAQCYFLNKMEAEKKINNSKFTNLQLTEIFDDVQCDWNYGAVILMFVLSCIVIFWIASLIIGCIGL